MSFIDTLNSEEFEYLSKIGLVTIGGRDSGFDIFSANNLALFYSQKNDSKNAIKFYLKVKELYESMNKEDILRFDNCKEGQTITKIYINSLYNLGVFYQNEYKDYEKAKCYYEIAAEQKEPDALNNLGVMYLDGMGIPKDIEKGVKLLKEAALLSNVYAQNTLGRMYEFGIEIEKDIVKAEYWYKRASELGDEVATQNLMRIRGNTDIDCSHENGVKYISKNIDNGKNYIRYHYACGDCKYSDRVYNSDGHYQTYCSIKARIANYSDMNNCKKFIEYSTGNNYNQCIEICSQKNPICHKCKYNEFKRLKGLEFDVYFCNKIDSLMYMYKIACPAFVSSSNLEKESIINDVDTNNEYLKGRFNRYRLRNELCKKLYNEALSYELDYNKHSQAIEKMQRAAQLNYFEAQLKMYYYYTENVMIAKNKNKALFWLKKAARAGYQPAIDKIVELGLSKYLKNN